MFKPCPNCGFLVALIAGREASQRCPRCGSALLEDGELPPASDAPPNPAAARIDMDAGLAAPATSAIATDIRGDEAPVEPQEAAPAADEPMHAPATQHRMETAAIEAPANDEHAGTDAVTHADAAAKPPTRHTPSFATRRNRTTPRRGRRWPWAVALPLLALLLALQLLLSQRAELAQHATWRPLVGAACGVFGCELPAWREPAAFAMLARNVRPHATRAGVLHVTTSLRNDAAWPQLLPVVVVSLSDVDGRVLAARAVRPSEYASRTQAAVAPGDSVDIAFDVREPSPRVVSFDFQLR